MDSLVSKLKNKTEVFSKKVVKLITMFVVTTVLFPIMFFIFFLFQVSPVFSKICYSISNDFFRRGTNMVRKCKSMPIEKIGWLLMLYSLECLARCCRLQSFQESMLHPSNLGETLSKQSIIRYSCRAVCCLRFFTSSCCVVGGCLSRGTWSPFLKCDSR